MDATPELQRLAPVELSIVCFRYVPPGAQEDDGALDALNKALVEAVQAGGETFLTATVVRGRFALRACVLHYDTTEADIRTLVDTVRRAGARLAAAR